MRRIAWAGAACLVLLAGGLTLRDRLRAERYDYRPVPAAEPSTLPASFPAAPDLPGPPPGPPRRWLVVGWDGADWDLILPLMEQGRLPNLKRLMSRGVYGELLSFRPTLSPVLWTTVATGRRPDVHGILAFDVQSSPWARRLQRVFHFGHAPRRLYTNRDRRAAALWELLNLRNRPSLVVGYHNTFPVEAIRGAMVSNYLVHEHMARLLEASGGAPVHAAALVHPPGLAPDVLAIQQEVEAAFPSALRAFARIPEDERAGFLARAARFDPEGDPRPYFLKRAYVFDETYARVAESLWPQVEADLAMVHFQCLDLASHYFLYFHRPDWFRDVAFPPEQRERLDALVRRYRRVVPAFYEHMDAWLGRLVSRAGAGTAVLVLSDHGFQPEPDPARTGYHDAAPPGILVAAGPGIAAGRRLDGATLYDVFPTLAVGLGLPLSDELPGRPLLEMFTAASRQALPVRRVDHYPFDPAWVREGEVPEDVESDLEEQLRSLGYVE